jgi:hypothetical protein
MNPSNPLQDTARLAARTQLAGLRAALMTRALASHLPDHA